MNISIVGYHPGYHIDQTPQLLAPSIPPMRPCCMLLLLSWVGSIPGGLAMPICPCPWQPFSKTVRKRFIEKISAACLLGTSWTICSSTLGPTETSGHAKQVIPMVTFPISPAKLGCRVKSVLQCPTQPTGFHMLNVNWKDAGKREHSRHAKYIITKNG